MGRRESKQKESYGSQFGACVSKKRCIEVLTEEVQDHLPEEKWQDYEMSINRVLYEFAKMDGAKPKYHKGQHIKNWYTCGNCGFRLREISINYCPNCGYAVVWDSPRCLTK